MKNRTFKKSLAMFLSFLMVLTSLVFVVPDIAPEVGAETAAGYYHVSVKMNLNSLANGGHVIINYHPFNPDGSLNTGTTEQYKLVNSATKYYSGDWTFDTSNDSTRLLSSDTGADTGAIPGWPCGISFYAASGVTIKLHAMSIHNGSGTSVQVVKDGQWTAAGNTRTFTYDDSALGTYNDDWTKPTPTSMTNSGDSYSFTYSNYSEADFPLYSTREVKLRDQYGVQMLYSNFATWSHSVVTGTGSIGVEVEEVSDASGVSTGRLKWHTTVEQNLPSNTTDGKLVYKLRATYNNNSSIYTEITATLYCTKYTASYVNAAGTTVKTVDAGYYNNTYNSNPSIVANTATASTGTSQHRAYYWPSGTYSVTGNITINEQYRDSSHSMGSWSSVDGTNHTRSCSVCGYTETVAHTFGSWSSTDDANHSRTCSACGYVETAGHNFGNWVSDGNDKNGTHTKTCSVCGKTSTTAHTWNDGVVTTEPKCATDGEKTYTCTDANCGATYTEVVPKTNAHVYGGAYTNVDTDGNGTLDSHSQRCVSGDENCQAISVNPHIYGNWAYENETNHVRTCTVCKLPTAKETHTHSWDDGTVTTDPDCINDGERTFTCAECGGTKTAVEPATGHVWGNYEANSDGITHKRTCTVKGCGETETNASCAFNHYDRTQAADCIKNEIRVYTCDYCSNMKTVEGGTSEGDILGLAKASGHQFLDCTVDDATVDRSDYLARAATCTKSAMYYKYCKDCYVKSNVENYNQTAAILGDELITQDTVGSNVVYFSGEPRLGHDYSSGVAVANNDRTHSFRCVRYAECGTVGVGNVTEDTVKCSADCSTTVTQPTCTATGYTTYDCNVCTNKWTADETPMAAHKWISTADEAELADFVNVSEADCDSKAVYYKNCSVCDQSAETIDATQTFEFGSVRAHNWSDWTADETVTIETKDTTTHSRYCQYDDCDAEERGNHSWTSEVTQTPTYDEKGIRTYTCSVCGATFEEEIDADVDTNVPTVAIKWGETTWNSILNTITFGAYVNYDIELEITSSDAETGVASVEYYISNVALTEDEVKAITAWEAYDADNKLTISKANENDYVVYAKVTDNADNVSYAGTNGFVIDTTKPEIIITPSLGANEEAKVYCGQVVVTASDANNVTATLDGYNVAIGTGVLVNSVGEHTVVVTDDAGNSSTVTFAVNTDHIYENYTETTPADCENNAKETGTCVCGATDEREVENSAAGHEWEDGYCTICDTFCEHDNVTGATCVTPVTCDICGYGVYDFTNHVGEYKMFWLNDDQHCTQWECCGLGVVYYDHVYENYTKTSDATCLENAKETGYCECGGFDERDIENTALDHDIVIDKAVDPTCEGTGLTEGSHCSRCNYATVEQTEIPALGHTDGEAVIENEVVATCTEDGSYDTVVYCTVCSEKLSSETIPVSATGHTDGEAVIENEVAATCTDNGSYDTATYCTVCGTEISRENTVVPALGHTDGEAVVENEVAATCTEDGSYDTATYCTVCGEETSRENTVVPATGHTDGEAVIENEVAETCTDDGSYDTVVYCTVCGEETSRENTVVPATGHTYDEQIADEAHLVSEATCQSGSIYYYDCSVCGSADKNESYVWEDDDKLPHDFSGEWSFSVTTDQHQRKCADCDAWTELADCTFNNVYESEANTDTIHSHKAFCECGNSEVEICTPVKGETHADPTCGDDKDYGWTDYSCEKCSNTWEGDKTFLLHDLKIKEQNDGDCRTKGYILYECVNDGCPHEAEQELSYGTTHVGNVAAGTRVTVSGVKKATCDEEGYTGDTYCECGVKLASGETIPADENAHQWGTPAVQPSTCVIPGFTVTYCEDCGEERKTASALDPDKHENIVSGVNTEPTCTEVGYTSATVCEDCGAVVTPGEPVPALGHKIGPWEIITMPSEDGTTPGYAERWCLRCDGQKETRNDFYYNEIHYVVYHNDNGVRLTAPRYYIEGDYTLRPEKNPTKNEDDKYTYEFIGWDHPDTDLDYVTKQMPVVAQYKAIEKSYTVTFYDGNGNVIPVEGIAGKEILFSDIANAYTGSTPTKASTADYTYEFVGWNIECDYETGEASVVPEFRAIAIEKDDGNNDGIFGWLIRWIKSLLAKLGIVL